MKPPLPANTYLAGRLAERYAADLVAYSGFEWPKSFLEGDNLVSERLHDSAMSFAINARRYLEHTGERPQILESRYIRLEETTGAESRLYEALHGLVHSRSLQIQFSPLTTSQYQNQEGCIPVYFVYETDKYPKMKVSVFGMAWTFLTLPKADFADDAQGAN